MKDIDFDELDRAVSSLMGTVPENNDSKGSADDATMNKLSVSSVSQSDDDLAQSSDYLGSSRLADNDVSDDDQAEAPVLLQPSRRAASPPATRRGRFMDVVRPASQTNKSGPYSAGAVSRHGSTIQPMSTLHSTTLSSLDTKESDEAPEDVMPVADQFSVGNETFDDTRESSVVEPLEEAQIEEVEDTSDQAPLSSPFLPDAKVEKRPLGRPAEVAPSVDLAGELSEDEPESFSSRNGFSDITSDKDAQLPEQPLPAEFSSELLSIETGEDHLPFEPSRQVAESSPEAPVVTSEPTPSLASSRTAVASIPQQYKVQPPKPESDVPVGTLYDAQPLTHPAEKKPGWLWVLAIIGIILLGVGFGVAFYYLRLN